MIAELAITKQLAQHRQRVHCERLIDEGFLTVQCLDRRATWQRIFSGFGVHYLGKQFADRAQAFSLAPVSPVQWLAENILSTGSVVAKVQPIAGVAQGASKRFG